MVSGLLSGWACHVASLPSSACTSPPGLRSAMRGPWFQAGEDRKERQVPVLVMFQGSGTKTKTRCATHGSVCFSLALSLSL